MPSGTKQRDVKDLVRQQRVRRQEKLGNRCQTQVIQNIKEKQNKK